MQDTHGTQNYTERAVAQALRLDGRLRARGWVALAELRCHLIWLVDSTGRPLDPILEGSSTRQSDETRAALHKAYSRLLEDLDVAIQAPRSTQRRAESLA